MPSCQNCAYVCRQEDAAGWVAWQKHKRDVGQNTDTMTLPGLANHKSSMLRRAGGGLQLLGTTTAGSPQPRTSSSSRLCKCVQAGGCGGLGGLAEAQVEGGSSPQEA